MLCILIEAILMSNSKYHCCVEDRKYFPKLSSFASWPSPMINPQWIELPISQANFHGSKDIRATEVWLYWNLLNWLGGTAIINFLHLKESPVFAVTITVSPSSVTDWTGEFNRTQSFPRSAAILSEICWAPPWKQQDYFLLTHCGLETPKRVTGKQCRPRSEAAERGIWSGSLMLANSSTIFL